MKRYPIWSYLSISALDAPLISVSWYLYFTQKTPETSFSIHYCIILAFSVWLGYMADRLFDVRCKQKENLISLRHRFCKENEFNLWILWIIILVSTVIFSVTILYHEKIVVGLLLMLLISIYTLLNQCLARNRFPKEICISILFAYGTLFFVKDIVELGCFLNLTIICFINCLILTHKDKLIDKKMNVESWTHPFNHKVITIISATSAAYFLIFFQYLFNPFFITCLACTILHYRSNKINEEVFRVLLESAYVIFPLYATLLHII